MRREGDAGRARAGALAKELWEIRDAHHAIAVDQVDLEHLFDDLAARLLDIYELEMQANRALAEAVLG